MQIPDSSYVGRHAELYDLFYSEKSYPAEAQFVHECLQQHQIGHTKKLIELACGTGTHSLLLEKLGYEITATDYSADMLAQAQKKARAANSHIDFKLRDMRSAETPAHPDDAAICLFDSLGYVIANENVLKVLDGVRRQLRKDGLFIFEFWHAAAMLKSYDPLRIRRWKIPGGEVVRISETSIDYAAQTCTVAYTIYELLETGMYRALLETQVNRFFLVQEMAHFLEAAHFSPIKWFDGFTPNENIDETTWHVVCVARAD